MKVKLIATVFSLLLLISTLSCAPSTKQVLATNQSQVKLRAIQTRAFDTTEKEMMLRTVIATLQDLSFIIDKADDELGTVSATKLDRYALRMTVAIRPRGDSQLLVRANAQYEKYAVEDPEPYQQFFEALSKALFLTSHQVD